jgi:hypothetical protein
MTIPNTHYMFEEMLQPNQTAGCNLVNRGYCPRVTTRENKEEPKNADWKSNTKK